MTADEVFAIAAEAVKRMADEQNSDFRFTYDQIWSFLPNGIDVPSVQRPGPQRRLIREGYIRKTGKVRNAASVARAGSPSSEYRFGTAIVGERPEALETGLINTLNDERTGCLSLLATMPVEEYLNFIENAYNE